MEDFDRNRIKESMDLSLIMEAYRDEDYHDEVTAKPAIEVKASESSLGNPGTGEVQTQTSAAEAFVPSAESLFGLTHKELKAWSGHIFESRPHVTFKVPHKLTRCPAYVYLDVILADLSERRGHKIQLDEEGMLPERVAKRCRSELHHDNNLLLSSIMDRTLPYDELMGNTENRNTGLRHARIIAQMAGIITVDDNCVSASKETIELYKTEGAKAFYPRLLEAWILYGVQAFEDTKSTLSFLPDFSEVWLFYFWRILKRRSFMKATADLLAVFPQIETKWQAVPVVDIPEAYATESLTVVLYRAFVRNFLLLWGFSEIKGGITELTAGQDVRVTPNPIFLKAFEFDVTAPEPVKSGS